MITGLEYFRLRSAVEGQSVFGVLVTTMTKLYQFQGNLVNRMEDRPLLQSIFNAYLNVKGKISAKNLIAKSKHFHSNQFLIFKLSEKFIEIPSEFPVSRLRLCLANDQPTQVAWMTGNGVLLAQVYDNVIKMPTSVLGNR
jgi:hypothetical protein